MSKKGDRAKGHRVENLFVEQLEAVGFICDKALPNQRTIPNFKAPQCRLCFRRPTWTITKKHDHFGIFDVMAKHPGYPDYWFWFQIAANKWKGGKDRKAIEIFPRGINDVYCIVRKMDRKPFDIRVLKDKKNEAYGEVQIWWNESTLARFLENFKARPLIEEESFDVE